MKDEINGLWAVLDGAKRIAPTAQEIDAVVWSLNETLKDESVSLHIKIALDSFLNRLAE